MNKKDIEVIKRKLKTSQRLTKKELKFVRYSLPLLMNSTNKNPAITLDEAIEGYNKKGRSAQNGQREKVKAQTSSKKKKKKSQNIQVKKSSLRKNLKNLQVSPLDRLESYRNSPQIGLGLETNVTIPAIHQDEVVIDKVTQADKKYEKHILYTPGWVLSEKEIEQN